MCKQEYLEALRERLSCLPRRDADERINFYAEMIEDRIEDGSSEEAAIAEIGTVDTVFSQIIAETPLVKLAKERIIPKRRLTPWEITLLAVGSPIWISLLIAAFSVVFSLYVTLWSLVASAWSVFASLAACAPAGVIYGIALIAMGSAPAGIAMIGAGLVCGGLSIFAFWGCKAATKGAVLLTGKLLFGIKKCFIGKGGAK